MLNMKIRNNTIHIGDHFSVQFERTLRIPDDDGRYPLPPGLGAFPICRVEDYADRVPMPGTNLAVSLSRCISARRCGCRSGGRTGARVLSK